MTRHSQWLPKMTEELHMKEHRHSSVKCLSRHVFNLWYIRSQLCLWRHYCTLCDMYGMLTGYNMYVTYRRQVVFQKLHALKMRWKKTCILTVFSLRMYSHGSHDHWEVARSQWLVLLPFVEMSNTKKILLFQSSYWIQYKLYKPYNLL